MHISWKLRNLHCLCNVVRPGNFNIQKIFRPNHNRKSHRHNILDSLFDENDEFEIATATMTKRATKNNRALIIEILLLLLPLSSTLLFTFQNEFRTHCYETTSDSSQFRRVFPENVGNFTIACV